MNILFISSFIPTRRHAGSQRVFDTIRDLSREHEIYLIAVSRPFDDEYSRLEGELQAVLSRRRFQIEELENLTKWCKQVWFVSYSLVVPSSNAIFRVAGKMWRKISQSLRPYCPASLLGAFYNLRMFFDRLIPSLHIRKDPEDVSNMLRVSGIRSLTEQVLRSVQFDAIVLEFFEMGGLVNSLPAEPLLVFSTHEDRTINWHRLFEAEKEPALRYRYWLNWKQAEEFLKKSLWKFDAVIAFTDKDQISLSRFCEKEKVVVVPTGVDIAKVTFSEDTRSENTLVFLGYFGNIQNIDAAQYLCQDILPKILEVRPDVQLLLVGSHPPPSILKLGRNNIQVTGFVEDFLPFLREATVFVAPIRLGGGIKGKNIISMALGTPVVTTSRGAEGLLVKHGEHLLIADSTEEFAGAVLRMLGEADLRKRLAINARKLVEMHYDWQQNVATLRLVIAKGVKRKRVC